MDLTTKIFILLSTHMSIHTHSHSKTQYWYSEKGNTRIQIYTHYSSCLTLLRTHSSHPKHYVSQVLGDKPREKEMRTHNVCVPTVHTHVGRWGDTIFLINTIRLWNNFPKTLFLLLGLFSCSYIMIIPSFLPFFFFF